MESLAGWLNEQLPEDSAHPTLIHNDFKLDNVMLDPGEPQLDQVAGPGLGDVDGG
jgi:aminoglycoside phosphotransferase (APT) family kinase protein